MINTIYIDMDGVLADFDDYWEHKYGDKKDWCDVRFKKAVIEDKLFEKLDPMNAIWTIINFANHLSHEGSRKVYILSSVGTTDLKAGTEAAKQKTKWLKDNGIFFKPIFVSYLEQKGFYANRNSVLIDDNSRATDAFKAAGGHAIHHITSYNTLVELKELTNV